MNKEIEKIRMKAKIYDANDKEYSDGIKKAIVTEAMEEIKKFQSVGLKPSEMFESVVHDFNLMPTEYDKIFPVLYAKMIELIGSLTNDFESLDNFELYSRTFIHYYDEFYYKNGGNKKVDTNYSILTPSVDVINKMPFNMFKRKIKHQLKRLTSQNYNTEKYATYVMDFSAYISSVNTRCTLLYLLKYEYLRRKGNV